MHLNIFIYFYCTELKPIQDPKTEVHTNCDFFVPFHPCNTCLPIWKVGRCILGRVRMQADTILGTVEMHWMCLACLLHPLR